MSTICHYFQWISYSLPNEKNLDCSTLKAFTDNKIYVTENLKSVLGRAENIIAKGENAGYQRFLRLLQCFQKSFLMGLLKVVIVW